MAGRRRNTTDHSSQPGEGPTPGGSRLPADYDLAELYGAQGGDGGDEDFDDAAVLVPPIALPPQEELAAAALAVPLIAHALRLARWAAPHRVVDEFGDLVEADQGPAARLLGLAPEDGEVPEEVLVETVRAWSLACDLDLVTLGTTEAGDHVAVPAQELEDVESGDPAAVLDLWLTAAGIVRELAVEADSMDVEGEQPDDADDADESGLAELEEASEAAAELLDEAVQVLYEFTAFADPGEETVPLGVLAALLVVPEGEEPDEEMLGEITDVMVALDPMLADLAELGVVEHSPIDPDLFEEEGEDEEPAAGVTQGDEPLSDEDAARFGTVRLTPLGQYAVREWLLEEGYDAPLVGELSEGSAEALLTALAESTNLLPDREIAVWLAGREPAAAARELLEAARGRDAYGPVRRMYCAAALISLGPEGDEAFGGVVDDPELGALARDVLRSHGAQVEAAERGAALWQEVDAFAAVLLVSRGDAAQLQGLVAALPVTDNPASYFGEIWRVPHPYTVQMLETVGELHLDRQVAKEARKAAVKAKSFRAQKG